MGCSAWWRSTASCPPTSPMRALWVALSSPAHRSAMSDGGSHRPARRRVSTIVLRRARRARLHGSRPVVPSLVNQAKSAVQQTSLAPSSTPPEREEERATLVQRQLRRKSLPSRRFLSQFSLLPVSSTTCSRLESVSTSLCHSQAASREGEVVFIFVDDLASSSSLSRFSLLPPLSFPSSRCYLTATTTLSAVHVRSLPLLLVPPQTDPCFSSTTTRSSTTARLDSPNARTALSRCRQGHSPPTRHLPHRPPLLQLLRLSLVSPDHPQMRIGRVPTPVATPSNGQEAAGGHAVAVGEPLGHNRAAMVMRRNRRSGNVGGQQSGRGRQEPW